MAFWEMYALQFKILQLLLTRYLSHVLTPGSKIQERIGMKGAIFTIPPLFSAAVGAVIHITTLNLSFYSVFFLSLFTPAAVAAFSPGNIFLCNCPSRTTTVKDMGEGLWRFLQWSINASNLAPVRWTLLLLPNAFEGREGWLKVMGTVLAGYSVGGSVFVVAGLK